jgi:hypothetical protein
MDPFFQALGRTAVERWQASHFSPARFPAIARQLLEERTPHLNVDLDACIRGFLLEDEHPFQSQSGFGQPEIVVFDHPRLYVQLLFWLEGTTDIHQHEFSGAFHVLAGSSLHSQFKFLQPKPISAHLKTGTLQLLKTELLEKGTTVEIHAGSGFIHSLFHLDSPSVTVVLRTHTDPGTGPQFTYLPPHLAVNPFHQDSLTQRRKQLLDALEHSSHPDYPELVLKMLGSLDFERGFFILQNCVIPLRQLGHWKAAWSVFRRKHGALAKFVTPTLEEILRRDALSALRAAVTGPEHRFFLALLLNLQRRKDLLRMVASRFSGPPQKTIERWLGELFEECGDALPMVEHNLATLR